MIDFRYHIVSIVAIFLALGLGILLGSSVVSDAVDAQLSEDLTRAREQRASEKERADQLATESDAFRDLVDEQVVPWAVDGRLSGARVVLISDGVERAPLVEHVEQAIVSAGARPAGTITLRERWALSTSGDEDALATAVTSAGLDFDPGRDPAETALRILGENFLQPAGRELITTLSEEGFLSVDRDDDDDGDWPPSSSLAIALSPSRRAESGSIPHVDALVAALGDTTPTLAVTDRPEGQSIIPTLRQLSADERPDTLATFDAATDEADPGGLGVVAALLAATEGQGGDWGVEGERFLPPNTEE